MSSVSALKAKPQTAILAPSLDVIRYLLDRGASVKATDPKAMENMKAVFKDEVEWASDPVHAAAGSDAVALLTDWPQYSTLPFRKIAATMNAPIIFDGRNCLNREVMRETGFQYYPIGRPQSRTRSGSSSACNTAVNSNESARRQLLRAFCLVVRTPGDSALAFVPVAPKLNCLSSLLS